MLRLPIFPTLVVVKNSIHLFAATAALGLGLGVAGCDPPLPEADAGSEDAGAADVDAGPGDVDAGPGDVDAGPGDVDAGPGDVDAGPGNVDAGPGDVDAGPGDVDAGATDGGSAVVDAGATDAGPAVVVDAGPFDDCGDADPLTRSDWVGFCSDRVDDNCTVDVPADPCGSAVGTHNFCATGDEACPSTQPGSAPPTWDCTGSAPANVIAFSRFTQSNDQVSNFCVYVYESTEFAGEHYVAVDVSDGTVPNGPSGRCAADYSARRHLFLSDLVDQNGTSTNCPDVKYIHAYPIESPTNDYYPVDDQKLSNSCRKMIRNIVRNPQPNFDPDIQYFAASRSEALGKLAILETVEVACVGIDKLNGMPYRPNEIWTSQATARIVMTGN